MKINKFDKTYLHITIRYREIVSLKYIVYSNTHDFLGVISFCQLGIEFSIPCLHFRYDIKLITNYISKSSYKRKRTRDTKHGISKRNFQSNIHQLFNEQLF